MQDFDDPDSVASAITDLKQADVLRAQDRTLIQDHANGYPPLTPQEADDNNVEVNVNFGVMARTLHKARRQYENAFLKPSLFFTVKLDGAPPDKGPYWESCITTKINRAMKDSLSYVQTLRSVFAGVVLHGVGPVMWKDKKCWEPDMVAIEDMLLPTDTDLSLKKLPYFAVRQRYTYLEIADIVSSDTPDPGWNLPALREMLDTVDIPQGLTTANFNWTDSPEKAAEIVKQNRVYWTNDTVPCFYVWNFYHMNRDSDDWWLKVVLDVPGSTSASVANNTNGKVAFLYKSEDPVADNHGQIIHFQFGDGSNKPPFKYHSIRSIGFMLYDVCELFNRLQSQFTQHVFDQTTMLFRVNDPGDRGRSNKILLFDKGVVPNGVTFVTQSERYQVDARLVQTSISGFRQLISETAASYTQDVNDGTSKELTATEVMARVNDVNALISSLLNVAYLYQKFQYREICRRFCLKDSDDKDVKAFQKKMKEEKIPEEWLDVDKWTVEPEKVLGGGHKMLEITQSRELMSLVPQLGPEAQDRVRRRHIGALTDDYDLAYSLVPETKPTSTPSSHDAELAFGAMMGGSPVQPLPGLNRRAQAGTMLELMQLKVQQIEQSGGVGTRQEVIGLGLSMNYVEQLVAPMQNDEGAGPFLKQVSDGLSQIGNMVKAFAQRQMEQEQKKAEAEAGDPVAQAKIQLDMQRAQMQAQIDQQRIEIERLRAQAQIQSQNEATMADIQRKNEVANAEIARKDALALADMQRQSAETRSDIASTSAKTRAGIIHDAKKTDATIQLQKKKDGSKKKTDQSE